MANITEAPPLPSAAIATVSQPINSRVYARIGLLGNPSDGFCGKTISFSLQNFFAEVHSQQDRDVLLSNLVPKALHGLSLR